MKVEIRQIASADVDDLEAFHPPRDSAWLVQADVTLSLSGDPPGGDVFQFEICSERWLLDRLGEGPVLSGRRMVVREFDYGELVEALQRKVDEVAAHLEDWEAFARALNWFLGWEFENYKES